MDLRIAPSTLAALQAGKTAPASAAGGARPVAGEFAKALGNALQSVSDAHHQATTLQRQFQAGAEGVSLEQTMIAMQKAQIGFQAALAVRNRLVSAYTDIMNMQV